MITPPRIDVSRKPAVVEANQLTITDLPIPVLGKIIQLVPRSDAEKVRKLSTVNSQFDEAIRWNTDAIILNHNHQISDKTSARFPNLKRIVCLQPTISQLKGLQTATLNAEIKIEFSPTWTMTIAELRGIELREHTPPLKDVSAELEKMKSTRTYAIFKEVIDRSLDDSHLCSTLQPDCFDGLDQVSTFCSILKHKTGLQFADPSIRGNFEIAEAIVRRLPHEMRYTSKELRNNPKMVLAAFVVDHEVIQWIGSELFRNTNFLTGCVIYNLRIRNRMGKSIAEVLHEFLVSACRSRYANDIPQWLAKPPQTPLKWMAVHFMINGANKYREDLYKPLLLRLEKHNKNNEI